MKCGCSALLNVDLKVPFFLTSIYKYTFMAPKSIALSPNLLRGFCIHHLLLKQIIFEEEGYGKKAQSLNFCILFLKVKFFLKTLESSGGGNSLTSAWFGKCLNCLPAGWRMNKLLSAAASADPCTNLTQYFVSSVFMLFACFFSVFVL